MKYHVLTYFVRNKANIYYKIECDTESIIYSLDKSYRLKQVFP